MVLVDYPDSDDEVTGPDSQTKPQIQLRNQHIENEPFISSRKRKHDAAAKTSQRQKLVPPSLPSAFHSLYATNVRTSTSDDPSLHEGRKRQVPHIEGKWPTHVYLEWYPSRTESETLENVIGTVQAKTTAGISTSRNFKIHCLLNSDLGVQLPLHISLSAPLMLQAEQRAAFLETLQNAVGSSGVRPFPIHVTGLDWVSNLEKSRWFLVLRLKRPVNDGLNLLLAVANSLAMESGLEMLYADEEPKEDESPVGDLRTGQPPASRKELQDWKKARLAASVLLDCTSKFHFSIAWQVEEPDSKSLENEDAIKFVERLSIPCDCLKVKIGNVVHDISLPERRLSQQCLGGI